MTMRLVPLIFLFFTCTAVGQATVYKTVDEDGVVSFSDTPPAEGVAAEKMDIDTPAPQPTGEYQENLDAMRETTDRMAADRREREKHRAEMKELQARQQPAQESGVNQYNDYYPGYSGGYYGGGNYRPGRPPLRPGYKPKPEHPIAKPPERPGQPRPTKGNSQLMRPIIRR